MKKKFGPGLQPDPPARCGLWDEPPGSGPGEPSGILEPAWQFAGEQGLAIFVCISYMDEAERCNKVGLIYKGR